MSEKTFEVTIQHPDAWDFGDVEARLVLSEWQRDTMALRALFPGEEFEQVDARRAQKGPRTVVFLTYENKWAKSGGVAAVAAMLPAELTEAGEKVIRLSPYHSKLRTAPNQSELEIVGTSSVNFEGAPVPVTIYSAKESGREWYLFKAGGFFEADGGVEFNDPYVFNDETRSDRDGDNSKLLRDTLFAAEVVPQVLATLVKKGRVTHNMVIHAQDWEFASVALTIKEAMLGNALKGVSASVALTLHNPFDHCLSDDNLHKITDRYQGEFWPLINDDNRTVLSHMIPLTDTTISTVSRRFAQEFTSDPLQTGHFAGHYQGILTRQKVIGIDNGLFMQLPSPDSKTERAIQQARQSKTDLILKIKQKARKNMLEKLEEYLKCLKKAKDEKKPVFGTLDGGNGDGNDDRRPLKSLPDDIPIFLMVGRLDPGQKGFDVFARAIEALPGGTGRYVISPLSPFAFDPDFKMHLDYLRNVAESRPGEVVVMPFRLIDIYSDLREGVTWSVWPSLYEPFGGVTEFYISGTPVIARATGGLVQQVIDYRVSPADATGILYRENAPASSAWQDQQHRQMQNAVSPIDRQDTKLCQKQVDALVKAITEAIELFRNNKPEYGRILANLSGVCHRLDWKRSVQEYRLWYDSACIE